jgi:hypothetical protein
MQGKKNWEGRKAMKSGKNNAADKKASVHRSIRANYTEEIGFANKEYLSYPGKRPSGQRWSWDSKNNIELKDADAQPEDSLGPASRLIQATKN